MVDKQTKVNGDIIAGLAEQSAQGYLIQAQDEEIEKLKAQLDQAVEALTKLFKSCEAAFSYDELHKIDYGTMAQARAALDAEELHFFDDLYEPDPVTFWDLVKECDHTNRTDHYEDVGCSTPYCSGNESHCRDCGVYITECGC